MQKSEVNVKSFSLERDTARKEEISLLMSHFFTEYLREIHCHYEGDLALVMRLGGNRPLLDFGLGGEPDPQAGITPPE